MYEISYRVDQLSAVGDWVIRRMHRGCGSAVTPLREATYVELPIITSIEGEDYASLLALIVWNKSSLTDNVQNTHSLEYVTYSGLYDPLHVLIKIQFG